MATTFTPVGRQLSTPGTMYPMMPSGDSDHDCPTCGRDFSSLRAMRVHHTKSHGESLVATQETCHSCGATFIDNRNRDRDPDRRFCGNECRLEWMAGWEGDRHPRHNSVTVQCAYCGQEVERARNRIENYNMSFCDPKCFGKWRSERTGEDHPLWQGGKAPYGEGWDDEKKEMVRERDGRQCQRCGLPEGKQVESNGRKLAVHHIIPARRFDNPEERNAMDNLITFCDTCHRRWEGIPVRPTPAN